MAVSKKPTEIFENAATIRPLRPSSCSTLSGSSTLKYFLGSGPSGQPLLRIASNNGGGFFSQEWVAWKDIKAALQGASPITSSSLVQLFTRKSANTAGFLLAVLVKEKLVEPLPDKIRHFKLLDPAPFLDRVAKLSKSANPSVLKPSKTPATKKAPPKKKAKK